MNQMQFKSRANEAMYDKLAIEFLQNHLPKIMDIVPKEVREERGETGKTPGKLFDENLKTISTKTTYVKRIKTYIKWHVINKGISSLGEITPESTKEFFSVMASNIGDGKGEYSTKTYDSYVNGVDKFVHATTKSPESAKTKLEGRGFGNPIESLSGMKSRELKKELKDMVPNYSQGDYKRGKEGGYTVRDAQIIMKQAEKHMDIDKQLLVATFVYGGVRLDEARQFSLDCYDAQNKKLDMLKPNMNKQDRPRVVMNVDQKLFDLVEKYKQEQHDVSPDSNVFQKYTPNEVREIVKECCRLGKIGYSGVHDLRKSFTAKSDTNLYKAVLKGQTTKKDLADTLMQQVSADPRLNRDVPKKEWKMRKTKSGKTKYYQKNVTKPGGGFVMEPKFTHEKLMKMNIENLVELYISEQLGHNKMETNMEYRGKESRERRKEFRQRIKEMRKSGVKDL
ncbi:site-specific integrase [Bacillus cereus group sp. TH260-2LC]|uniref:site-specific integrase n=1 Tax=Bacillus cereus group TaxID=86661 RepID=UPI0011A271A9|nr:MULTISPECIES: site-specific integrase [Bacillus cereus group]MDA1532034.1 site-specific integrase [Bacillus cereus group sp. TH260-2LC]